MKITFRGLLIALCLCHLTAFSCEKKTTEANPSIRKTGPTAAKIREKPKFVIVSGFVNRPGPIGLSPGMTVDVAIEKAGGRGGCEHCDEYKKEVGSHPSYRFAPRVFRGGRVIKFSNEDKSWEKFMLEPADVLEVPHVLW